MIRRLFFIILLAIGVASCGVNKGGMTPTAQTDLTLKPSTDEVEHVEQNLVVPKGARELSKYDRYYATEIIDNERYIRGKFVIAKSVSRIFIVDIGQLPATFDGGCGVLLLRYSVVRKEFDIIRCSGIG